MTADEQTYHTQDQNCQREITQEVILTVTLNPATILRINTIKSIGVTNKASKQEVLVIKNDAVLLLFRFEWVWYVNNVL